jgi:putative transposase
VAVIWLSLWYIENKMIRKEPLITNEVYHVFNRSIAGFHIFNNNEEFLRMKQLIKYYQIDNELKFSAFIELKQMQEKGFNSYFNEISAGKDKIVQIIAYSFMPTHIHLILKQLAENGIVDYMIKISDSYTRYFNTLYKRKGPLWESRFKNVLVKNDEQLLHLTRYAHLNSVTAKLVNRPEDWEFSSYKEYLGKIKDNSAICQFNDLLEIEPSQYRKFVNNQISYQRELSKIKDLLID